MRYFIFGLLFVFMFGASSLQAQNCPDIGMASEVVSVFAQVTAGSANNVRAEPHASATLLGQIPALAYVRISDSIIHTCSDGLWWWYVHYGDLEGWTVGYINDTWAINLIFPYRFDGVVFPDISPVPIAAELIDDSDFFSDYLSFHAEGVENYNWYRHFQMTVFNVQALAEVSPINADRMTSLRTLLAERPDLSARESLPYVGGRGVAQILRAQADYIDLPHIVGIRYLSTYAQTTVPIAADTLLYEFSGFTPDFEYVINLRIPVVIDSLPAEGDTAVFGMEFEEYDEYLADVMAILEADSFSSEPSLLTLDSLLGTLQITPESLIYTGDEAALLPSYQSAWDYGACDNSDFPSRLEIGMVVTSALSSNTAVGAYITPIRSQRDDYLGTGWFLGVGELALVIDGPVCDAGQTYWMLYNEDNHGVGWLAESGLYFLDNEEHYYLGIMPTDSVTMPEPLDSQATSDCSLFSALSSSVYEEPNSASPALGSLLRGVPYYADAYYQPQAGGFQWWRLTTGATIRISGEETVIESPLWVFASSVVMSQDCAEIPILTSLGN